MTWRRQIALGILLLTSLPACEAEEPGGGGSAGGSVKAPLRRLTTLQYDNTVRDLFALDTLADIGLVSPGSAFPADESAGPFRSNYRLGVSTLHVDQFQMVADKIAKEVVARRLDDLLDCDGADGTADECATRFIGDLGSRAFRRPLADEEIAGLLEVFRAASTESFEAGIELVLSAILQSPSFLYLVEKGNGAGGDRVRLTGFEIASRLSYLLWNTMPDGQLWDAAASGALDTDPGLELEFDRLMGDARAKNMLGEFHLAWLESTRLDYLDKDPVRYPIVYETGAAGAEFVRGHLKRSLFEFVDYVIRRSDSKYASLMTAPVGFLDGPLFRIYGMQRPTDHEFENALGLDPNERAGILTHPAFLATQARTYLSDPVHRGLAVVRSVLCQPIGSPPEGVEIRPVLPDPEGVKTRRQKMETEHSLGACASCHRLIDPMGFALDEYGALGEYRTYDKDDRQDVDAAVVVAMGKDDLDGPVSGAVELSKRIGASVTAHECYARQWFRFGLGREISEDPEDSVADLAALRALQDEFLASGGNIRGMIRSLVLSDTFRTRRVN